jgi:hypothetical protein
MLSIGARLCGLGQVSVWAKDVDYIFVADMNCAYKVRTIRPGPRRRQAHQVHKASPRWRKGADCPSCPRIMYMQRILRRTVNIQPSKCSIVTVCFAGLRYLRVKLNTAWCVLS